MKSIRICLIVLLSFYFVSTNAQFLTGGSFGFNTRFSELELSGQKTSSYDLSLMPFIGKFLSEKLAVGLALDISLEGQKNYINNTISKSSDFGVSPFLRYYALKWNKFSIYGQGNIGIGFSSSNSKTDGIITEEPNTTRISLGIFPGLSYNITDRLSLETSIKIFNLGYNFYTTKDGTSKNRGSSFNIGGGLGNIISVGSIVIGGIYKF